MRLSTRRRAKITIGSTALSIFLGLVFAVMAGSPARAEGEGGALFPSVDTTFATSVAASWGQGSRGRRSAHGRRGGGKAVRGGRRGGGYAVRGGGGHSSGGVRWVASASCLNPTLRGVVQSMTRYGSVTVSSTCRSHAHNRRVGGAKRSYHIGGNAVDFRVHGNVGAAYAALRSMGGVGGLKHYGGGLFHVDTGPRRRF